MPYHYFLVKYKLFSTMYKALHEVPALSSSSLEPGMQTYRKTCSQICHMESHSIRLVCFMSASPICWQVGTRAIFFSSVFKLRTIPDNSEVSKMLVKLINNNTLRYILFKMMNLFSQWLNI